MTSIETHELTSRERWLVVAWSAAMALLIAVPWWRSGYLLSYDMVWVPDLDLTRPETWGLGSALPRAVPSDAVIAIVQSVLPAALVQRLVLLGLLIAGGVGAARLASGLPLAARLAAASVYVWNPFVAERLVIGHWPLLVGYAALPWLIVAVRGTPRWPLIALCIALLSMSATGGLIAASAVVVLLWGRGAGRGLLLALAINAPWVVAGLAGTAATRTDGSGAEAFSAQPEGPLGTLGALASLGGIWNAEVALPSRELATTAVIVAVIWIVMIRGISGARTSHADFARLVVLAAVGFVLAASGWLAPGLVESLITTVPGSGALRDGTRFLALVAPLYCVLFAHGVAWLLERIPAPSTRALVGAIAVLIPLTAIPDLAVGAGGRLTPVDYPTSWATIRAEVEASATRGDLLVLPFTSYRAPDWNENRSVLDPSGRFYPRETVVSDDLVINDEVVRGEDARARAVGDAIAANDLDELRQLGIGLVVYDSSAPADESSDGFAADLTPTSSDGSLILYDLGDAEPNPISASRRVAVIAAWAISALTLIGAGVVGVGRLRRRSQTTM